MAEPQQVTFQVRSYSGGMNAAALPSANIRPDEMALAINGVVRNGFLKTRPGWHWQTLSFLSPETQAIFEYGRYQGSGVFLSQSGAFFVYAVDGHIFFVDPSTWVVRKITDKPAFSKYSKHVWIKQRNKWLIAQDGVSPPLVTTGFETTQEVKPNGVPLGTFMVDGWHRLAVVSPDRRRIYFSDHELDPNSTPISFTEGTSYFASARYFEAPPSLGRITGMAFTPFQDTSTGIGPLMVFCERGVRAYNIAVPRTQWATSDISQTILPRVGASSFFAYADKGSEVIFRDHAGRIRTIRNAQQTEATDANFANDFAIWPLVQNENPEYREYSQAVTFDGRTLILVHPTAKFIGDGRTSIIHRAIAVLENESLSDKQDTWTMWTGHNICGFDSSPVNGAERCIAFCADPDGRNRLYELTTNGKFDTCPSHGGISEKPILMTFSPQETDFGDAISTKMYRAGGMRLTGMRGLVEVSALWQRDGRQPKPWFQHAEQHPVCMGFSGCELFFGADGSNPRLVFSAPPDNEARFQKTKPIFKVKGPAQVEEFVMVADILQSNMANNVQCVPETQSGERQCGIDIFEYDAFSAQPITPTT